MSDNPYPVSNQPDQESGSSTVPGDDPQYNNTPPRMVGGTSDPTESIQNTPSEHQAVRNEPMVNESRDMPSTNLSMPASGAAGGTLETWLDKNFVDEIRSRWNAIQVQFVDSPCSAVEQGETLVAEIMDRISQILTDQQNKLNDQWLNHDDITTEELRITLQNYRNFLNHLLKL